MLNRKFTNLLTFCCTNIYIYIARTLNTLYFLYELNIWILVFSCIIIRFLFFLLFTAFYPKKKKKKKNEFFLQKFLSKIHTCVSSSQLNFRLCVSTGGGEPVRRGWGVRVSSLCRGLRILRGRLPVRGILELADENRDSHSGVLCHRLFAGSRPFHLEIREREGKWAAFFYNNGWIDFFFCCSHDRRCNLIFKKGG